VNSSSAGEVSISVKLQNITTQLREIQDLLTLQEQIDPRILTDFRDAVNRVRNTAWALEQYANSKTAEADPTPVLNLLAGERVRVAYQLLRLVQTDLTNPRIQFQKGQLLQLQKVTEELAHQLRALVGE